MKILLIIFYGGDETSITSQIKKVSGNWARITQYSWCIKTSQDIVEVRNNLSANLSSKNILFIVDITNAAWNSYCLPKEVAGWLKN